MIPVLDSVNHHRRERYGVIWRKVGEGENQSAGTRLMHYSAAVAAVSVERIFSDLLSDLNLLPGLKTQQAE